MKNEIITYQSGQTGDLDLIAEAVERGCEDDFILRVHEGRLSSDRAIFSAAFQAYSFLGRLGFDIVHEEVGLIGEGGYDAYEFFGISDEI